MTVINKKNISSTSGDIPKGTEGILKGVSNSVAIKQNFPESKVDDWFYMVIFPPGVEVLCNKEDIDIK